MGAFGASVWERVGGCAVGIMAMADLAMLYSLTKGA